jgi:hypothetical protein
VELDELDVGQHRPGPQRETEAVTGGSGRIRGPGEQLAGAPGRQHHGPRGHVQRPVSGVTQPDPGHASGCVGVQGQRPVPLQDDQPGRCGLRDQGPAHLGAGGIPTGPDHPGRAVTALPGPQPAAPVVDVEHRAPGGEQPDRPPGLVQDRLHGGPVAQAGPGHEGVLDVQRDVVAGHRMLGRHRGQPALGPDGAALGDVTGDHQHPDAELGGVQRGGQPGHPAADDQHVDGHLDGVDTRSQVHSPPPDEPIVTIASSAARARSASSGSTWISVRPVRRHASRESAVDSFM